MRSDEAEKLVTARGALLHDPYSEEFRSAVEYLYQAYLRPDLAKPAAKPAPERLNGAILNGIVRSMDVASKNGIESFSRVVDGMYRRPSGHVPVKWDEKSGEHYIEVIL